MNAAWISPYGKIIEVGITHINYVIQHPEEFKLTSEQIQAKYTEFGEPVGMEGNAREAIMVDLMRDGWLRVRETRNFWTVQGWEIGGNQFRYLRNWVDEMFLQHKLYGHDYIHVEDLKTNKSSEYTVSEIMENEYRMVAKKSKYVKINGYSYLKGQ